MSDDMGKAGILALMTLTGEETKWLLRYLKSTKNTEVFDFLYAFEGERFLKFIDLFSGEKIRIPRRGEVCKIVESMKIYTYVVSRGGSEEAITRATKMFGKRKNSIRRILLRVERILGGGELGGSSQ